MKKLALLGALAAMVATTAVALTPNDPRYGEQTALTSIKVQQAWDYNIGGSGPSGKVAIISSGLGIFAAPADIPATVVVTSGAPDTWDWVGQTGAGTPSASIIASTGNNGIDLAGVMWQADLRMYKTYSNLGLTTDAWMAQGINDAVTWGAQVIHIDPTPVAVWPLTLIAVNNALANDRIVVIGVASFGSGVGYLAANAGPELLVVSAGDVFGNPLGHDGEGPQMDLVAPGHGVLARASGGCCFEAFQPGTPAAFVTGVAGLLREMLVGEWNTRRALLESATDLAPAGFDNATGYGLLNADCAMALAGDMNNSLNHGVDITDAQVILALFGQAAGDRKENVNGDAAIDLQDALIDLSLFGAGC